MGKLISFIVQPIISGLTAMIANIFWSFIHLCLQIIDGISKFFEWLAFENWNGMMFGTNGSETIFFPKHSSPLFLFWIIMLSFGILLIVLFIVMKAIKTIQQNIFDDEHETKISVTIVKAGVVGFGMFCVPFGLMTGMSLTSGVTKMLFDRNNNTQQNATTTLTSAFGGELNTDVNAIYDFTSKANDFKITDGSTPTSLISHEDSQGRQDIDVSQWANDTTQSPNSTIQPFPDINNFIDRMTMEIRLLQTLTNGLLPSDLDTLVQGLQTNLSNWNDAWIKNGEIKTVLSKLATYASQASSGVKNDSKSDEIQKLKEELKKYETNAEALLANFALIQNSSNLQGFSYAFPQADPTISSYLTGGASATSSAKWDVIKTLTDNTKIRDSQVFACLYNISNLSRDFIGVHKDSDFTKFDDSVNSFDNSNEVNLKTLTQNIFVMLNGYGKDAVSLFTLAEVFATRQTTPLVLLIFRTMTGQTKATDWNTNSPFSVGDNNAIAECFIGIFMAITIFFILGQLIKRVVLRFAKLAFLWGIGMVVLPSSLTDNGGRARAWFSMVVVELLTIFAIGMLWYIWKAMASPIFDLAQSVPINNQIAKDVGAFFMVVGLLETIVQAGDWFGNIIGSSTGGFADASAVTGKGNLAKSIMQRGAGSPTGAVGGSARGIMKGNSTIRGAYNVRTGERVGGLLGKNGIRSRWTNWRGGGE